MNRLYCSGFKKVFNPNKVFVAQLSCHESDSSSTMSKKPLKVLVTGAAGQIGYSILPRLARGDVWGCDQPVILKMFDLPVTQNVMDGVRMELEDCSFKSLKSVQVHTNYESAFADNDVIIMLANSMDLKANMTRADLLKANLKVYKETAEVVKATCHKDTKVLMVANPANTNCMLLVESLRETGIPHSNFTSLTRLDHNRTKTMVANKLGVPNNMVRKVIVWGNHSNSMYPDLRYAEVCTGDGWVKVQDILKDKSFFNHLVPTVRQRAFAVISARGKSSSLSASNASIDHLRNWLVGTDKDDWVSMGVYCDESPYPGVPKGVVFGLPCTCHGGQYKVVTGLSIDPDTQKMIDATASELLDERKMVGL